MNIFIFTCISVIYKYIIIFDYYCDTENEEAYAYLKRIISKFMAQIIENGDTELLKRIIEKTDFLTKKNIDKFITQSIESNQIEIQTLLTNYKNEHIFSL